MHESVFFGRVQSLKVYLCGVQLWSRMNAYSESIAGMERLHYVLRGIRKLQGNAHLRPPRLPITRHMLHFMFDGAALFSSVHDRDMIRSAITLAFFGLLRISEFCPPSVKKFSPSRHLTVGDVSVDLVARFASVSLKESKSDPFRLGVIVRIGVLPHRLCPVRALATYLLVRGPRPGPLFVFDNGAVLTRVFLVNLLRQWFPSATTVNTHSFRRGGATALASSGVSSFMIQLLGRWRSNSYLQYIDITEATLSNAFHRVIAEDTEDGSVQRTLSTALAWHALLGVSWRRRPGCVVACTEDPHRTRFVYVRVMLYLCLY